MDIEGVVDRMDHVLSAGRTQALAVGVVAADARQVTCRGSVDGRAVTVRTSFYAASVTKQVIGLLLARLTVAGAAGVDDPVRRWLPELPDWVEPVRLRHLVHHTSDLPDVTDPTRSVPADNAEVIERLQRWTPVQPLEPGARYAYNNAGYVLLAEAVGRMSGRPVDELAAAELFRPLALRESRLGGPAVRIAGVPDPPGTIGDGGLWTSVTDLTNWLDACNRDCFGDRAQRVAETPGGLDAASPSGYAWGVRVSARPYGPIVTHGGSWGAWLAKTVRVPARRIAVAVLSVGGTDQAISDLGTDLAEALATR
ncbi:serine hydrolase [Occultella aeris]|uniref:Penicillin-binding protein 4 n=1 Tax=Occultella aeris TaxID=2761496 RepID=A0A7M4DNP1_9MICO|nr:serine hydrolase domain-containing protein [Occultella aeris]VZO39072.1 Penicillin-binding protein 4* [Occultella aeris]